MERETGWPADGRRRVVVADVRPSVEGGRHAVKRTVGERLRVEADLVVDGHDQLAALLQVRRDGDATWTEIPMRRVHPHAPNAQDGWWADVVPDRLGTWAYRVEGWVDAFATWRHGLARKVDAGQDVAVELLGGARLVGEASYRAHAIGHASDQAAEDARVLAEASSALSAEARPQAERAALALDPDLAARVARHPDRALSTTSAPYRLLVERERARFSAWYELFPRSFGEGGRHGTLRDVMRLLPYVAEMGFDVLYLPPIHPIGTTNRKGRNNSLVAGPDDPGSPWAIGAADGGHDALHPALGTLDDLSELVARARELGIDVAIDVAFQASPDHPWVREHPDWFVHRADGSIQYAENPPKKYQDVYPFDFESDDWRGLWTALADVFLVWAERGIRTFRVDNPHTKPVGFWEWCLARVRAEYPDAIFLSEAFTRPLMLEGLAKIGFSQSYTYFTWRTTAAELRAYCERLRDQADVVRPNFWPNTPDILPEHLQIGGRPAFMQRAILAATLTASWGIYGPAFELCEASALPGKEEYLDSEKYQLRQWDLEAPHSLRHLIARLNRLRREHPALQQDRTLRFHATDSDSILCYSKTGPASGGAPGDTILCVVSLDPFHRRAGWVDLDLDALGLPRDAGFQVHDLLGEGRFLWHGPRNYVELDPEAPGHVFAIRHRTHREHGFEYYL